MMSVLWWMMFLMAGYALALPLAIQRHTIDQRRGGLTEILAISFLALGGTLLAKLTELHVGLLGPHWPAAPFLKFLGISLSVFVITRLLERWWAGERLQLVDLFRITTVAGLTIYSVTSLTYPLRWYNVLLVSLTYVLADRATGSSLPARNLALVFSFSFLACILTSLTTGHSSLELIDVVGIPSFDYSIGLETNAGRMALLVLISSIVSAPLVLAWVLKHATWLQRIGLRLAAWQLSFGQADNLIHMRPLIDLWHFRPGVCFLNHGSFGAVPLLLRIHQHKLRGACEDEPMDFLSRNVESQWLDARFKLAGWLGTQAENIAFCENATAGMNEIARWFPIETGNEVLLNDHEYGAVRRIWQRRCAESGAKLVSVTLPLDLQHPEQITQAILSAVTPRTRLVVLSHITSPTAIRLPVEQICVALRQPPFRDHNLAICIDGPHALLQEPLRLHRLGCDFYTASCHKWLCAPLGSGLLYVAPKWHDQIQPLRVSWGRLPPAQPEDWTAEMLWTGTRDYSAYLTVPQAIHFFSTFAYDRLDARNHALACYARERLCSLPGAAPVTPAGREWFGWMVAVWLPDGDHATLQQRLWKRYKIEVPIVRFADRYLVRVSCHLYNTTHDIEFLVRGLRREISAATASIVEPAPASDSAQRLLR